MNTEPGWTRLPAAVQAADAGHYAVLLRLARIAAGLTNPALSGLREFAGRLGVA